MCLPSFADVVTSPRCLGSVLSFRGRLPTGLRVHVGNFMGCLAPEVLLSLSPYPRGWCYISCVRSLWLTVDANSVCRPGCVKLYRLRVLAMLGV